MKIFIVGLPMSGRTTVAKALVEGRETYQYIDATSWVRSTFRNINQGEHPHQYEDEYQQYLSKRTMDYPQFITDNIIELMEINGSKEDAVFVIDGISSPRDFIHLFDYQKDIVVFLNRTDNTHEYRDHENIGTSVIRDYCFWMSAASLITKQKWLEYNFRIPGEYSTHIKVMGAQSSVFIVKSIAQVISHLREKIWELTQ